MNNRQTITACVFLHKDNKVLIGKRAETKQYFPGKWELPGGHIDFGETVEEGLKRELKEEYQIDIIVESLYHEFTWVGDSEHIIEVLYTARMVNPEQKIVIKTDEITEYRWIRKNEIGTYFAENDFEAVAVRKGFEFLEKTT